VAVDQSNNVYVADENNHTIRKVTPAGVVTTLAGLAGQTGSADGTGSVARFRYPSSVAVDLAGNVYVADSANYTVRKITPSGEVTTLAGLARAYGWADGDGANARFAVPHGLAVDPAGNIYVADDFNHTIRKITPAGTVTSLAGGRNEFAYGTNDGVGLAARFYNPHHVALDAATNIYVSDGNNQTIRKITPQGEVTTLAGLPLQQGSADGVGSAARFNNPWGVAADDQGNVFVADVYNGTIRKVTPQGAVTTIGNVAGRSGCIEGVGTNAYFSTPYGVALDASGRLFVADTSGNRIVIGTPLPGLPRPLLSAGVFSNGTFFLSCPSVTNRTYFLEARETLSSGNWSQIGSYMGDGSSKLLTDTNATGLQRFYRVRVQ
jgi:sugar lactone lactonase YvrE